MRLARQGDGKGQSNGEHLQARQTTGLPFLCLSRLPLGKQSSRLDAAAKLARYLGIKVVLPRSKAL